MIFYEFDDNVIVSTDLSGKAPDRDIGRDDNMEPRWCNG